MAYMAEVKPSKQPDSKVIIERGLDKPRRLFFTLGSLETIEEQTQLDILNMDQDAMKLFMKPKTLAVILAEGLKHEDPDITPEKIKSVFELSEMKYIMGKVAEAIGGKPEANPTKAE
jgi:hypothetical protein